MKKISVNIRYLIVPIMSLATVAGIIAGGIYVWTGVILFGANTFIDILTRDIHHRADFDSDGQSYGIKSSIRSDVLHASRIHIIPIGSCMANPWIRL